MICVLPIAANGATISWLTCSFVDASQREIKVLLDLYVTQLCTHIEPERIEYPKSPPPKLRSPLPTNQRGRRKRRKGVPKRVPLPPGSRSKQTSYPPIL
jgi:hypothetical protein